MHKYAAKGVVSFKLIAAAVLIFILLLGIFVPAVSAHRIYIIKGEGEAGRLQVLYEGGVPAGRAVVTLYDRQGNIIGEGPVDRDGFLYFDHTLEIGRATASDGLGHLAHFDFEPDGQQPQQPQQPPVEPDGQQPQQPQQPPVEPDGQQPQWPLPLRVLVGLLFLGIIGIIFHNRKR